MPRSHRTSPELPLARPLDPSAVLAATGALPSVESLPCRGGAEGDVPLAPPRSARVHLSDRGGRECNPPEPGQTAPTDHVMANQRKRPPPPPPSRTDPTPPPAPTNKGGVGSLAASPPSYTPPGWVSPRSSGGYCGGTQQYIPRTSSRAPPSKHSRT